jgi:hypothetical protein
MTSEIRDELEAVCRRFLELLVPLQAPEGASGEGSTGHERLRRALWSAVRELDPLLAEARAPEDADLTKDDPETQKILHALVVREYFSLRLLDDPGDVYIPAHTPDECELRVFFQYGRWFVTWMKLEEDRERPEASTRQLLVFGKDQNGRFVLTDV